MYAVSDIKIVWTEEMETGHPVIDRQHKKLVDAINELFGVLLSDDVDFGKVTEILQFLADYTDFHFSSEEKLMKRVGYPGFDTHKEQHIWFIAEVNNLILDFLRIQSGAAEAISLDELLDRMEKILVDWLKGHIMGTDKKLGAYLLEVGELGEDVEEPE